MPLLMKHLLSYLHSENVTFQYYGSEFESVYAVSGLPEEFSSHPQRGFLYISSEPALVPLLRDKGSCILFTSPEQFGRVLALCSDYLIWHHRKEDLLLRFYDELINTPTYLNLIRICSSILDENPVVLLNEKLIPRVHSDDFDIIIDDSFIEMIKRALTSDKSNAPIYICASRGFPADIFIGKIKRDNSRKTEYLCIIEQNKFRCRPDIIYYISTICNALAKHNGFITLKSDAASGTLEELILNLLDSPPSSPSSVRIQLAEAGWEEHEQYYVLAIDKQNKNHLLPDYTKLQSILNTKSIYEYKNYIVAVLGYPYFEWPDDSCLNALSDYLKTYGLSAGISNGFSDITMLNSFFNQSVKAIEINEFYNYTLNYRVVRYTDFSITHLLEIVSKSSNIKIIDFCHPTLLYILEYDKKNNTDYLNTLSAYILSNSSIKLAAQVMYIHTNTMYNRITKIRNDFKLDLDNITLIAQLYISFQILGMLQITDVNVWARIHRPIPQDK